MKVFQHSAHPNSAQKPVVQCMSYIMFFFYSEIILCLFQTNKDMQPCSQQVPSQPEKNKRKKRDFYYTIILFHFFIHQSISLTIIYITIPLQCSHCEFGNEVPEFTLVFPNYFLHPLQNSLIPKLILNVFFFFYFAFLF